MTPAQRHDGDDLAILEKRKRVYEKARKLRPERWSGKVRNWDHDGTVELNPVCGSPEHVEIKMAA